MMTLIDAKKRFEAKRAAAKRKDKPGGKLPPDHLASVTSIAFEPATAQEDDEYDRMVEKMSEDADEVLRKSTWLRRRAERIRDWLRRYRKKD